VRFGRAVALFTLALSIGATAFGPAPAFSLSYPLSQPVSENPANITPHVLDGTVYAIAEVGNRVVVAGSFTKVRRAGSTITRNAPEGKLTLARARQVTIEGWKRPQKKD